MAHTVLVVDDDPDIRDFLSDILSLEGCAVMTAPDGQAALEHVQEVRPDLILLDYQMPRCDGARFVAAYRQLPGPHAPVVLITGATRARQRAAEVGADAFLGKPFEVDALLALVARYAG